MIEWFSALDHPVQALLATTFTWLVTSVGAAFVFIFREMNKSVMDAMLGFAGGVMTAASFWSLLSPAISMADELFGNSWLVVCAGFLCGGLLLFIGDRIFGLLEKKSIIGGGGAKKRILMLIFSITLHNIPEGLAVGVAFGSLAYGLNGATLGAASMLAFGIGLQNFPEGFAISVPLRREGKSRLKSFAIGSMSGIVEPISGVVGAVLVTQAQFLLPFLLAFAAGAMIYVVVEEIIPESQTNAKKDLMACFSLIGFAVMMVMDVALG